MYFPKCGGRPANASHWLNSHDLWWGSWPLTFLHNSESHFTNCAINIWWVLHLAGECPIVSGLQVPDNDGNIITLNIPIPGDSFFKPPSRQLVGLLQVIKYLQERKESVIPTYCAVFVIEAARGSGVALAEAHGRSWRELCWPSHSQMNSEAISKDGALCISAVLAHSYPQLEFLQSPGLSSAGPWDWFVWASVHQWNGV